MENKKYSLLVVALYCYMGHVKSVIEHLKRKNPLVDITLLSNIKPEIVRKEISDSSIKIEWYNVKDVNFISNKALRAFVIRYRQNRFFAKFSKNRRFDIVNVHFPKRHLAYARKYLKAMSEDLVISPWGSDILRQNEMSLKQLRKLYKAADYITILPDSNIGQKIIEEFGVDAKKMIGGFFGSDVIDYAIKYGDKITQEESKAKFGLEGRYVITCGYNRKTAQRHKEIIEAISNVKDQLPDNLTLLFPMTYANPRTETDYVEECRQLCLRKKLNSLFVTDFLSVEDLYKLRKSTDMFVHVQTTDAGSACVQEYILCDTKIVHGAWLKYKKFEEYQPLFYFPVERMDELGHSIVDAYFSEKIKIPQGVISYVKSRGWDNRSTMMNNFFMSIVKK